MGFTRTFYLKDLNYKITLNEVKAGVLAIATVANRLKDEFKITHIDETSIVVVVRSGNPVEGFLFKPVQIGDGYILDVTRCKTNEEPEDEGIKEMLKELQKAVNDKLIIKPEI